MDREAVDLLARLHAARNRLYAAVATSLCTDAGRLLPLDPAAFDRARNRPTTGAPGRTLPR